MPNTLLTFNYCEASKLSQMRFFIYTCAIAEIDVWAELDTYAMIPIQLSLGVGLYIR